MNTSNVNVIEEVQEVKSTAAMNSKKIGSLEEVIIPGLISRIATLERGLGRVKVSNGGEELLDESGDSGGNDIGEGSAGEEDGGGDCGGEEVDKEDEEKPSVEEVLEKIKAERRNMVGKRDTRYKSRWLVEDLAQHDTTYIGPWLKFLVGHQGLKAAEVAAREEITTAGDRVLATLRSASPQARANARNSTVLPRSLLAEELDQRREGGSLLLLEFLLVDIIAWDKAVKEESYSRYPPGASGGRVAGDDAMVDLEKALGCTGTRTVSAEQFVWSGKNELRAIGDRLAGVGRTVDLRQHGEQCGKLAYGMARRVRTERAAGGGNGQWSMMGDRVGLLVTLGTVGAAVAENRARAAYIRDCVDYYGKLCDASSMIWTKFVLSQVCQSPLMPAWPWRAAPAGSNGGAGETAAPGGGPRWQGQGGSTRPSPGGPSGRPWTRSPLPWTGEW